MEVEFPPLRKMINESFIPLWETEKDYDVIILMGGRDSSKTNWTAKKLILKCLTDDYFRCILIRKNLNAVPDSQWLTIKEEIEDMGLGELFKFRQSPHKITCVNGNGFLCRGMDNPDTIKSVKDPTCLWFEEDIVYVPERDYTVVTQSLRSSKVKRVQEFITLNPEVEGQDYQENWFIKKFYGERAETEDLTFQGRFVEIVEDEDEDGNIIEVEEDVSYTVHHSTYKHNRWCPLKRKARHEALQRTNPHLYKIFTLGLFGNKDKEGLFYDTFERSKHILDARYEPTRSLHITWDFNVRPYVSLGIWQYYDDREQNPDLWDRVRRKQGDFSRLVVKIDEIAGVEPRNRTKYVCEDFLKKYGKHQESLFIYGDPAGKQEDTRSEKGGDDFNIIMEGLKEMNPQKRVHRAAPSISKRGEWICSILGENAYDIAISFDPRCKNTIIDYTSGQADADGKKFKKKVKDPESGLTHEKYHHFSDGDDYFLTKLFYADYKVYLRGGKSYNYEAVTNDQGINYI